MSEPRGWYSRGYLPHIDAGEVPQFVNWRAADSLPAGLLEGWKAELAHLGDSTRRMELARRVEAYCDMGHGECLLRNPRAARAVQECLFHDHGTQYILHAWVVMPNHVHALITPCAGKRLGDILKRVKSSSAGAVNRVFGRSGRYWQPDYFDRLIRNEKHFDGVKHYIEWNPVKAKLCTDPAKWSWSSCSRDAQARFEFLNPTR